MEGVRRLVDRRRFVVLTFRAATLLTLKGVLGPAVGFRAEAAVPALLMRAVPLLARNVARRSAASAPRWAASRPQASRGPVVAANARLAQAGFRVAADAPVFESHTRAGSVHFYEAVREPGYSEYEFNPVASPFVSSRQVAVIVDTPVIVALHMASSQWIAERPHPEILVQDAFVPLSEHSVHEHHLSFLRDFEEPVVYETAIGQVGVNLRIINEFEGLLGVVVGRGIDRDGPVLFASQYRVEYRYAS